MAGRVGQTLGFCSKKRLQFAKILCTDRIPVSFRAGPAHRHPRPYTAMDIIARKEDEGYNVLFP